MKAEDLFCNMKSKLFKNSIVNCLKIISETLVSARFFYKSKLPALFSMRNRLEKSKKNVDL